jgi:hypothetical protein
MTLAERVAEALGTRRVPRSNSIPMVIFPGDDFRTRNPPEAPRKESSANFVFVE